MNSIFYTIILLCQIQSNAVPMKNVRINAQASCIESYATCLNNLSYNDYSLGKCMLEEKTTHKGE